MKMATLKNAIFHPLLRTLLLAVMILAAIGCVRSYWRFDGVQVNLTTSTFRMRWDVPCVFRFSSQGGLLELMIHDDPWFSGDKFAFGTSITKTGWSDFRWGIGSDGNRRYFCGFSYQYLPSGTHGLKRIVGVPYAILVVIPALILIILHRKKRARAGAFPVEVGKP